MASGKTGGQTKVKIPTREPRVWGTRPKRYLAGFLVVSGTVNSKPCSVDRLFTVPRAVWEAGLTEGFLVHDELLGTPKRDRLACVPNGESAIQIVRVMKRYLAKNPEKAHRATRYIASPALAGAFPCRGGK